MLIIFRFYRKFQIPIYPYLLEEIDDWKKKFNEFDEIIEIESFPTSGEVAHILYLLSNNLVNKI